jgi:L-2,4-diaminobutyrate decarboxylase
MPRTALPPAPPPPPHAADALAADVLAEIAADAGREAAALLVDLAAEYLADAGAGRGRVSTPRGPAELARRFADPLPARGRPLAEVAERLARDVVADANRLTHPMAAGHQVSAPLPAAVWAEALVAALNQSVAVAEMSPTGTAVELQVVRWMADLAGLGPRAGGTFTSGGTEATFAALLAARSRAVPGVWTDGLGPEPPVVVCGEHAHYAVSRAAGQMGLGLRNVVTVASRPGGDGAYAMDPAALGRTLADLDASGRRVMAVVATAGSTATGSFDPLDAVADLCAPGDLWLHVDGAHGGSALLSARHRGRLRGVGRAHSLAWDPHKMMLLPLGAGVVLVREERWLEAAFAQAAPYLFQAPPGAAGAEEFDAAPRVWDQGVRSFQCSRPADALKAWVALQRHGAEGLGALYDRLCAMAAALHALLVAHPAFEPVHAPACNILCFRYVGRAGPAARGAAELDALNGAIRAAYNRSGAGWITTTVLGGRRVLRATVMNPRTTTAHLARLVDGLAAAGVELEASLGAAAGD